METHRLGLGTVGGRMDPSAGVGASEVLLRSPFGHLAPKSIEALLARSRLESLPKKHVIFEQGHPVAHFLLLGAGRVKLERSHHGRTISLGHRGPGQMVGEASVTGSDQGSETAVVVDEVIALVFPAKAVRAELEADASFRLAMAAAIVEQRRETDRRLELLLLQGVEARLVSFLLDAGNRWGQPHPRGQLISAPFTHAEIAQIIGSTRETVTLVLNRLRGEGCLLFDRRRVVIPDRGRLQEHVARTAGAFGNGDSVHPRQPSTDEDVPSPSTGGMGGGSAQRGSPPSSRRGPPSGPLSSRR